jgi:hypothetical protein
MDFSPRRLRFGENADSLAAHALLKSTPQLLAGERGAVAQGARTWPRHLRVNAAR